MKGSGHTTKTLREHVVVISCFEPHFFQQNQREDVIELYKLKTKMQLQFQFRHA